MSNPFKKMVNVRFNFSLQFRPGLMTARMTDSRPFRYAFNMSAPSHSGTGFTCRPVPRLNIAGNGSRRPVLKLQDHARAFPRAASTGRTMRFATLHEQLRQEADGRPGRPAEHQDRSRQITRRPEEQCEPSRLRRDDFDDADLHLQRRLAFRIECR